MNILLTNDDGYNAKGINLIKDKLLKYGNVVVVAPSGAMSAKSVSITIGKPLNVTKVNDNLYITDGTPADCVAYGLSSIDIKFNLVVSGCNHGFNVSYDTIYSGTIGACLQALTFQCKSVAFSCENNFEIVEKYFDDVFQYILNHDLLSDEYLLNVNFPLGNVVKKIEVGSLFYRHMATYYERNGGEYYALRNIAKESNMPLDSDCYQVEHQIVSVVPLAKTCFNFELLNHLKTKIK